MTPDLREFTAFPVTVPDLSTWTIPRVKLALFEHEQGQFCTSAFLFEALERSPRTFAALNTRVNALLGLPFALEAGDGDGRRDAPAVNKIKPHWRTRIAPNKTIGKGLRTGHGMGLALFEKVWRVSRDGQWLPTLKPWHSSFFYWNAALARYQVMTKEGLVTIEPGDPHWAIFSFDDPYDRPWMRGVVRCLGFEDSIRGLAVRDWARWSELHGLPTIKATIPADADAARKKKFAAEVAGRGQAATVFLERGSSPDKSFDLDALEFSDQGYEGFQRLIAQVDGDAEIALLGHPLTNTTGVYDPKDNSVGVRQDYLEADAEAVSSFLRDQVSADWARFNLGESAIDSAPRPCYDATPPQDDKLEADTVLSLGQGLAALNEELRKVGKQVAVDEFVERFDIPLENDTAKPEPAPVAAPGTAPKPQPRPAQAANALGAGEAPTLVYGDVVESSGLAQGQVYTDAVADAATPKLATALGPSLRDVLGAVESSTDYDQLRAKLVALAKDPGSVEFRRLLAASLAMAEAAGLWSVEVER